MKKKKLVILGLFVVIIFLIYENNNLSLTKYEYISPQIDERIRIIQISDLHNKIFGENNQKILDIIDKEKPDIIVITGDFVDANNTDIESSVGLAKKMVEIAPVYYVTGNHECSLSKDEYNCLSNSLKNVGIKNISDGVVKLKEDVYLIGLDDMSLKKDISIILSSLTEKIPRDSLKILLAHEPQYIKDYSNSNIDIVLSGHAHGGQIRIPLLDIGLIAPNQGLFPKYTAGEYCEKATHMFVSRGIGNSIIPLRIFNCPEIVELDIKEE